ncbi:RNA polymerase sigma factor [Niastella sp. OAS944]|uniref:RNA polymerase sigma factor n=1 Tax=Niastella sp. OAS944 TaxID=2664089 RepID=UPI0034794BBD|nr:RNA polymerase sigma-70 factor (ECF subfamily) [Chitinophagaceae bacterium OAS944]
MLAYSSYDKAYLVTLVAAGDVNAFNELFRLYWDNIYSIAFSITRSKVVAEEIVQDVFLKVWLKREQLAEVKNFDNYLFIIARNHIYNQLRAKAVQFSETDVEVSETPEKQLYLKETVQIITEAVKRLPKQQRVIFELSRNEGLDHAAIANRLKLSRLTVKTHMNKALHSIRGYLSRHNIMFLLFLCLLLFVL